jgi:DNA-binding XRE family transcriptional regulator
MSSAAARLKKLTDEIAHHLAVDAGIDSQQSSARFWDRPGGLELALVSFDSFRKEFVVRFKAGPQYRLPLRRLGDAGEVAAVDLDSYRHGVVVVFSDGRATNFASDLVLFECEPEYRARMAAPPRPRHVGQRVRALRLAAGRTATAVAAAAGMAPPNYARLEAAQHAPRADTLVRIAQALGVPVAELFQS